MTPRTGLLIGGAAFVTVALIAVVAVATAYWPLQSVVEVIAPFLGVSILASVGLSLIFTALLLPWQPAVRNRADESTEVLDSLLSETKRH